MINKRVLFVFGLFAMLFVVGFLFSDMDVPVSYTFLSSDSSSSLKIGRHYFTNEESELINSKIGDDVSG